MTATSEAAHSELRRSFGWRTIAAVAGLLSTFALTIVVYRSLQPRDAAVFFAILAALSIGPLLGRLGLGVNAMRLVAAEPDPHRRRDIASSNLRATCLLSVLTAPIVAIVATWGLRGVEHYVPVVVLTVVLIVAESIRLTLSDIFAATGRIRASVCATHHVRSMIVLPVAGGIALIHHAPSLLDVIVAYTAVAVGQLLVALYVARTDVSLFAGGGAGMIREAIGHGIRLFTLDLAAFLCLPGTIWLANVVFDPPVAAMYAAAATLAMQVTILESLAALAVAPPAARLWATGHRDQVVRTLSAVATLSTAVTTLTIIGLAAFGSTLLEFAYGPSMKAAIGLLLIMTVGGIAKTALGVNITLLIVSGHITQASRVALGVLALSVPAAVIAAEAGGPWALAVVAALSVSAMGVAQWRCTKSVVGVAPRASVHLVQAWQTLVTSPKSDDEVPDHV